VNVAKGQQWPLAMSQFQFQFPSTVELDAYAAQRNAERGWAPLPLDARPIREVPWLDAEEALSQSAFVDPISVMITFLRLED
jgi:hypothetical protein